MGGRQPVDETLLQRPGVDWLKGALSGSVGRWFRRDLVGDDVNHFTGFAAPRAALVPTDSVA